MGSIGIEHLKALKYATTVDILLRRKFIKPFYTTSTTTPSLPIPLKTHTYTLLYRFWLFKETHQKAVETGPRRNNRVLTFILTYNASVNSSSAHPPLGQPRGICSRCQSWGWGIRNFITARGLGICVPWGDPWAFDTRVLESAMDEFIGKDKAFVEQWLVCQGLEELADVFKRMFSQF